MDNEQFLETMGFLVEVFPSHHQCAIYMKYVDHKKANSSYKISVLSKNSHQLLSFISFRWIITKDKFCFSGRNVILWILHFSQFQSDVSN